MKPLRILAIALFATAMAIPQAWALGGGGFAPGAPLGAAVDPSCNGYNMDGTVNTLPGADRPGCVDTSLNGLFGSEDASRD